MSLKGKLTFELSDEPSKHCSYGNLVLDGKVFARDIHRDHAIDTMRRWNAFEDDGPVDKLVKALENSPSPPTFATFTSFAENFITNSSMAVYKGRFRALATFLRSCQDRSEKILQALTAYRKAEKEKT